MARNKFGYHCLSLGNPASGPFSETDDACLGFNSRCLIFEIVKRRIRCRLHLLLYLLLVDFDGATRSEKTGIWLIGIRGSSAQSDNGDRSPQHVRFGDRVLRRFDRRDSLFFVEQRHRNTFGLFQITLVTSRPFAAHSNSSSVSSNSIGKSST